MADSLPTQGAVPDDAASPDLLSKFSGVADKMFGTQDAPPKRPDPTKSEPPVSDTAEEVSADTERGDDKAAQAAEPKATEEAASDAPTGSLKDWLQASEVPFEQVLGLSVPVKVDGKDAAVPLRDVLKSYQLEQHNNNKSMELSEQLKAAEASRQQFDAQRQAEIQRLQDVGNYAQKLLYGKWNQVDWNALRANDPVEYAASWAQFQQEQGQLNVYLAQVQQAQQAEQAKAAQSAQAKLGDELKALYAAKPEWQDRATFAKDGAAITESLKSVGFSPQEIASITDHRVLMAAHKAALYDALQAKKPEVTQRVRAAPKLVTPGARASQQKPSKLAAARERLRKNPRDRDAQEAAFSEYADSAGWK